MTALWFVIIVLATIWLGTWVFQIGLIVLDLAITAVVWTVTLLVGLIWLCTRALGDRIRPA